MRKNGFTLVEVILAIALIGLIAVTFVPAMTFGYQYLIDSEKFVVDSYAKQQDVEKLLEAKRKEVVGSTDVLELSVFGVNVKGHVVSVDIEGHGEINTFQPQRTVTFDVLEILPKGHTGSPDVLLDVVGVSPRPTEVSMFTAGTLNPTVEFLVNENNFKVNIPSIHLVNVYRWFLSSEQKMASGYVLDNYLVVKEWNAARALVTYAQSKTLKVIANMQNDPDYNRLKFTEIKDGLGLTNEEMINRYGNRFIYYSVTPYAISGRIGKEDLSNPIYIRAPRIEIDKAYYGGNAKQVEILFKESISDIVNSNMIDTNDALGTLVSATRSTTNDKKLILEFEDDLDGTTLISGNKLSKGAVGSLIYGNIGIWGGDEPNGDFTVIYVPPTPVTSVVVTPSTLTLAEGGTSTLSVNVGPLDATNLNVVWESSDETIVSVDAEGHIVAESPGTATITAKSVSNPTVLDTCTVIVPTDPSVIGAELEAELAKITTLSIINAENTNGGPKPVINAPSYDSSKSIAYKFTAGDSNDGTSIVIQTGNETALITRNVTMSYTLNITLTATKSNGVTDITRSKVFKVYIPSNDSSTKTVLIADLELITALDVFQTLTVLNQDNVNNSASGKPIIQAPAFDSLRGITYTLDSVTTNSNASVVIASDGKTAVVTRRNGTGSSTIFTLVLKASKTNMTETIYCTKSYTVAVPRNNSSDKTVTVIEQ